jgi:lysozyme
MRLALCFVLAACYNTDAASVDEALTVCSTGATVSGIDTSSWQGAIDWTAVKASGRVFAIARVSDGLSYPDGQFAGDWPAIQAAGLVRGAYQFFRPSQDPSAQANLFAAALAQAGPLGAADLPAILDLETTDGVDAATVTARARTWLSAMQQLTGKRPMVYTAAFMSSVIGSALSDYPLWVANYGVTCPRLPTGWSAWEIWQNGDAGSVPGVSGGVDTDVFNGTLADLQSFARASSSWSCAASAYLGAQYWTCSNGNLFKCQGGVPVEDECALGCISRPAGSVDLCISSAGSWSCAGSAYNGAQYWTCSGGNLYRCAGGVGEEVVCPSGCISHPLGTDDACR